MDKQDIPALQVEHDLSNEQIIIASALHDQKLRDDLTKKIPPDFFADEQHAKIWEAMRAIRKGGLTFDLPALHKELAGSVSVDYIKELMESYPTAAVNIRNHVEMLEWDHAKIGAVEGPVTELRKAIQANESPNRIRALARSSSKAFDINLGAKYMKNPAHLAAQAAAEVRKRANAGHYQFGIKELDYYDDGTVRMIPGCSPGHITLITGVPGSAKSTVAARIALEQARMKRRVLYGAWEMGAEATIGLLACMARGWDREKVVLGLMSPTELQDFEETCERIGEYVRFFDAPYSEAPDKRYSNEQALDTLYQNIADSGAAMCIMDLWERMIPDANPERERRALFAQQAIAQETMTHCVIVCQQKLKAVEASHDKRPSRNHILGSSAYVDISDNILGVHRPGLWRSGIDDDTAEVLILKQRYGVWPLCVEFDWDGAKGTITNGREKEYEHASDVQDDWLTNNRK